MCTRFGARRSSVLDGYANIDRLGAHRAHDARTQPSDLRNGEHVAPGNSPSNVSGKRRLDCRRHAEQELTFTADRSDPAETWTPRLAWRDLRSVDQHRQRRGRRRERKSIGKLRSTLRADCARRTPSARHGHLHRCARRPPHRDVDVWKQRGERSAGTGRDQSSAGSYRGAGPEITVPFSTACIANCSLARRSTRSLLLGYADNRFQLVPSSSAKPIRENPVGIIYPWRWPEVVSACGGYDAGPIRRHLQST